MTTPPTANVRVMAQEWSGACAACRTTWAWPRDAKQTRSADLVAARCPPLPPAASPAACVPLRLGRLPDRPHQPTRAAGRPVPGHRRVPAAQPPQHAVRLAVPRRSRPAVSPSPPAGTRPVSPPASGPGSSAGRTLRPRPHQEQALADLERTLASRPRAIRGPARGHSRCSNAFRPTAAGSTAGSGRWAPAPGGPRPLPAHVHPRVPRLDVDLARPQVRALASEQLRPGPQQQALCDRAATGRGGGSGGPRPPDPRRAMAPDGPGRTWTGRSADSGR